MQKLFTLLFFLFLCFSVAMSFWTNSYSVIDVYPSTFISDVTSWSFTGLTGSSTYSSCAGNLMMGGFDIINIGGTMTRTYTNVRPHNYVVLVMSYWRIDSIDSIDGIRLDIDNGWASYLFDGVDVGNSMGTAPLCGSSSWDDAGELRMMFAFPHSGTSITMKIISLLNQAPNDESFGISKITLDFMNTTTPLSLFYAYGAQSPSGSTAAVAYPNFVTTDTCDSLCVYECRGPGPQNCIECIGDEYYFRGFDGCVQCPHECPKCVSDFECISSLCGSKDLYAYWDGTCQDSCNPPNIVRNQTGYPACVYPCDPSEYAFEDGTCLTSCPPPAVVNVANGRNYCSSGCTSGQYTNYLANSTQNVNWDSTCSNTCDPPLIPSTSGGKSYCNFPCSTGQYLDSTNTCQPTCDPPKVPRTTNNRLFCDNPCPTSFLRWDSTCDSTCSPPLVQSTVSGENYCNYPCTSGQYLHQNGTCASSCDLPMQVTTQGSKQFCNTPCAFGLYLMPNGACSSTCNAPYTADNSTGTAYCKEQCPSVNFEYENGTCAQTCDAPFTKQITGGKRLCNFPCDSSQYLMPNTTCTQSCSGNFVPTLTGGNKYCDFKCGKTQTSNNFLATWNDSCMGSCGAPLKSLKQGIEAYCSQPCAPGLFLNFSGSCVSKCDVPFEGVTKNGIAQCGSNCLPPSFLYENGSCSTYCHSSFLKKVVNGVTLCLFPCKTGQYISFTSSTPTCTDTCDAPNKPLINDTIKVCTRSCPFGMKTLLDGTCVNSCPNDTVAKPYDKQMPNDLYCVSGCKGDQLFRLENGSCQATCDAPYVPVRKYGGVDYCEKPCKNGTILYSNGSCLPNCTSPFEQFNVIGIEQCQIKCYKPVRIDANGNCVCQPGYTVSADYRRCESAMDGITASTRSLIAITMSVQGVFLVAGANPMVIWSGIHLLQVYYYLVFMNVDYPLIVINFLNLFSLSTLDLLPNPLDAWLGNAKTEGAVVSTEETKSFEPGTVLPSPIKFYDNHYSGYFVQSSGAMFPIFVLVVFIYLVTKGLVNGFSSNPDSSIYKILKKALAFFEWSGLFRVWFAIYPRLTYSAFLQIAALNFSQPRFSLSSFFGLMMAIANIILPFLTVKMIIKGRKDVIYPDKYLIFLEDYKINTMASTYFAAILIFQRLAICAGIVFFYHVPAVQNLIPWASLLIVTMIYLFYFPHKMLRYNLDKFITNLGLFVIHTIIMIYVFIDIGALEIEPLDKEMTGVVFIYVLIIILGFNLLFILIEGIIALYNLSNLIVSHICCPKKTKLNNLKDRRRMGVISSKKRQNLFKVK